MVFRKDEEYLSSVEKDLYKKDAEFSYEKQKLKSRQFDVKTDWQHEETEKKLKERKLIQSPLLLKLFFISLVFFFAATGLALYRLFIDPIVSSPKNVDIVIQAPASVTGGEETQIQVIVTNNNRGAIEEATLEVSYPDGTKLIGVSQEENKKFRKNLGTILPGQQVTDTFRVVMFGEENTEKNFSINVEYRPEGSSATFSKNKEYGFILTTSPVSLSLDVPDEINIGEKIKISIDAVSNSETLLEDFMVVVEYPFGFSFEGSNPRPAFSSNVWSLGDLTPSEKVHIEITGVLEGQFEDQKTFKVFAGTQDAKDANKIDITYNSLQRTVLIERSFLAMDFSINGDPASSEVTVTSGETVTGNISWENTLDSQILNGEFKVSITGPIVDERTMSVDKGFYRSIENSIIWNQTTDRVLSVIEPGEDGSMRFSFKTASLFAPGSTGQFKNPEVTLELSFKGERVSPGFENETITLTQSRKLKISSLAQLASYGLYFTGPFKNTGPIPPKVDEKTTYTIVWSIVNSSNKITNAQVSGSLPIYVRWLGVVSPQNASVTFNDTTGLIIWNVGDVPAGAGISQSAKEISFQVEFIPSISQVGDLVTLLSEARFTGQDTFTQSPISVQARTVSTELERDPLFNEFTQSRVVQ
jgi:hypothetical protein